MKPTIEPHPDRTSQSAILLRCFGYLRPHWKYVTGVYLTMVLIDLIAMVNPQLIRAGRGSMPVEAPTSPFRLWMLKRMNRRTTAKRMREAIDAFRAARPGAGVRTTVLVGFPGETDEDFAELYEYMESVRFERAGVFTYSPQEDTTGARLPERVEEGIALDRLDRLMKLQKRICLERHRQLIGQPLRVLVERTSRGNSWGRSEWDAPDIDGRVRISGVQPCGEILTTTVQSASAYQLDVVAVDSLSTREERCGSFALPVLSRP